MFPYGYEQGYYVLCSCGWPQKQRKLYIFRNESTAKEKKLAEEGGAFLLAFGLEDHPNSSFLVGERIWGCGEVNLYFR